MVNVIVVCDLGKSHVIKEMRPDYIEEVGAAMFVVNIGYESAYYDCVFDTWRNRIRESDDGYVQLYKLNNCGFDCIGRVDISYCKFLDGINKLLEPQLKCKGEIINNIDVLKDVERKLKESNYVLKSDTDRLRGENKKLGEKVESLTTEHGVALSVCELKEQRVSLKHSCRYYKKRRTELKQIRAERLSEIRSISAEKQKRERLKKEIKGFELRIDSLLQKDLVIKESLKLLHQTKASILASKTRRFFSFFIK